MTNKELKEWRKKLQARVKEEPCPLLHVCERKVLRDEAIIFCADKEVSTTAVMVHAYGQHMWEGCEGYREHKRALEGKLPREWLKGGSTS